MTILIKFAAFAAALIAAFWLGGAVLKKDKDVDYSDYYDNWTPPGKDEDAEFLDDEEK